MRTIGTKPSVKCIVCDSQEQKLLFTDVEDLEYGTYKPVNYILCRNCNLISQYPPPQTNLLPTFYPNEYRNYLPVKKNLFSSLKEIQFKNLASKITKHISDNNTRILEIGFGNGQLLLALKQKGFKNLYGSDFTDKVFSSLKDSGIKLAMSNIEESFPRFTNKDESFDVIIMNNVIEHFLDPIKVLKNCQRHLSNNGTIILITPNGNALESSIFKNHWAGFHAPRHTFIFSDNNIKLISKNLGFKTVEIESMTDPGQWSISIQNILQSSKLTRTNLKNGMAWYLMPLSLLFSPIAAFQNLIHKSTSMMCVLKS